MGGMHQVAQGQGCTDREWWFRTLPTQQMVRGTCPSTTRNSQLSSRYDHFGKRGSCSAALLGQALMHRCVHVQRSCMTALPARAGAHRLLSPSRASAWAPSPWSSASATGWTLLPDQCALHRWASPDETVSTTAACISLPQCIQHLTVIYGLQPVLHWTCASCRSIL